ncbi:MAG: hypothetical protein NTU57_00245 [Candidatus Aenigmarchaeota archaeon]|nr:hypothetical protein [Candidatus Aenigmarchaeota archaeon]
MAVDIFEMLIDILKINQNQVAEYAAQGPLYQLFYLIFFPTIFIVIFVWILTHAIIGREGQHKAMRLLLAIAVYAFIVLQGLYNWFVMLSKFWLFGLMFLGFIYFITYRGGRGGGGGGAHGKTIGGVGSGGGVVGYIEGITGKKLNPLKSVEYGQKIKRDIVILENNKRALQREADKLKKDPKAAEQIFDQIAHVDVALTTLQSFLQTGDFADYEKWRNGSRLFK